VLRRFLAAGAPPTARWLRQAAADAGLDATALDALAAADTVHVSHGVVAVAYPFSGTPTPHRVELDGLPAVYAMCAIDALGMSAMPGHPVTITAAEPGTSRVTTGPGAPHLKHARLLRPGLRPAALSPQARDAEGAIRCRSDIAGHARRAGYGSRSRPASSPCAGTGQRDLPGTAAWAWRPSVRIQ
jgi:hypothetical protein